MNSTLVDILKSRDDLSDYLFHFTKEKKARETLIKITKDKQLEDINNKGVICFTEAPLLSLINMFKVFENYENPMYAPYGIAFKKDYLFNLGARNVIYGLSNEIDKLDNSIKWRFEEFIPKKKDFSWLREWRVPLNKIDINVDNCFIITKDKHDLTNLMFNEEKVVDIDFDGCIADGQYWGTATGITERSFKGISIEDLNELNSMSKVEIEKMIELQSKNDKSKITLGGFSF